MFHFQFLECWMVLLSKSNCCGSAELDAAESLCINCTNWEPQCSQLYNIILNLKSQLREKDRLTIDHQSPQPKNISNIHLPAPVYLPNSSLSETVPWIGATHVETNRDWEQWRPDMLPIWWTGAGPETLNHPVTPEAPHTHRLFGAAAARGAPVCSSTLKPSWVEVTSRGKGPRSAGPCTASPDDFLLSNLFAPLSDWEDPPFSQAQLQLGSYEMWPELGQHILPPSSSDVAADTAPIQFWIAARV